MDISRRCLFQILAGAAPAEAKEMMVVDLKAGQPKLYIKVQFLGGVILGRSFHYSDREVS